MIALPDQFSWRAKTDQIFETGRGLLSRRLKEKADDIEEFQVAVGSLIAAAYPKRGELHLDHRRVYHCPCRQAHKLIWLWRLGIELSDDRHPNTGPPTYMCHVMGLECAENKFAVQFLRDGTVKAGFE